MEVDCPDCAKETKFFEWLEKPICGKCKGTLKIKAYTQTELDGVVKAENKACTLFVENFIEYGTDSHLEGMFEICAEELKARIK